MKQASKPTSQENKNIVQCHEYRYKNSQPYIRKSNLKIHNLNYLLKSRKAYSGVQGWFILQNNERKKCKIYMATYMATKTEERKYTII